MSTMPGLLTDLYDCPKDRVSPGTEKHGELVHKDVYITFLSASTPSWLVTAINPSVIEGGFTSRVIFVVDDARKRSIAWPKPRGDSERPRTHESFKRTVEEARNNGSIGISKGGLKKFTNWYNSRASHTDPFRSGFEAREDDHLLRIAGCLAINDGTHEIQSKHIGHGSKIIARVKDGANTLFGGNFSYNAKIVAGIERVRDILIEAGNDGVKHHMLLNRVQRKLDASEFKMLMSILHECGMIQVFKVKSGKATATFYRATKAIEKFGVSSEVLSKLNLQ